MSDRIEEIMEKYCGTAHWYPKGKKMKVDLDIDDFTYLLAVLAEAHETIQDAGP